MKKRAAVAAGTGHVPVMLEEVKDALAVKRGEVVADVTLGLAGHAVPLLKSAGKKGRLVGIDLDAENLALAQAELAKTKLRFDLVHTNFAGLAAALGSLGLTAVDALVADLGVASTQIGRAGRGFSFLRPARLDMRMTRRADARRRTSWRRSPRDDWPPPSASSATSPTRTRSPGPSPRRASSAPSTRRRAWSRWSARRKESRSRSAAGAGCTRRR